METEALDYGYWNGPVHSPHQEGTQTGTGEEGREMIGLNYVFVYGSLLKGLQNHDYFLGQSHFVGEATTVEQFVMFGRGFPLVRRPVPEDNGYFVGNVIGEVYGVTDRVLAMLDQLEGHPHFYERRFTSIREHPTKSIWMYHWNDRDGRIQNEQVVPDPVSKILDWRRHLSNNRSAIAI